jgi:hypothetical protein
MNGFRDALSPPLTKPYKPNICLTVNIPEGSAADETYS